MKDKMLLHNYFNDSPQKPHGNRIQFNLHHQDKLHLHILIKIKRGDMQAIQTDLTNDAQQYAM